ncbi:hypothetical protein JCM10213_006603 [Rhodosporidiobolus nylandii]
MPSPSSAAAPRSPSPSRPPFQKKRLTPLRFLLISVVFHALTVPSIFDIYFRSPVVSVPERFRTEGGGLAKRVVLFSADGLRADKVFQTYDSPPFAAEGEMPLPQEMGEQAHAQLAEEGEDGEGRTTPAPYLRGLIQSGKAQWGVSHTRVPTESRPGHVALIGGMYEDVSAVTRGWSTNPVPFDSVFNQSSHAFTFGSPDILPMFSLGASPGRVSTWMYDEEAEDFTSDAVHLDLWVLDQLRTLLANASSDPALDARLRAPGTVFFEHLLGLDTTGHSYRPHGPEYHRNIRVVDFVVRETVKLLAEFFGDDETAFVFTADHGMSALGNHGDGHPDNTRTPLVAWGQGVRRRPDYEEPAEHDEYSAGWGLKGLRRDVEQADVAPLMSVLAGLPLPANSAGLVPLDYLDASPRFRAEAAFANAKQLLAEAEAKSSLKEHHSRSFRPFPELVDSPAVGTLSPASHRTAIEALLQEGEYAEAERRSVELGAIALRASNYFQKYDWLLLRSLVTSGYLGFIAFTAHFILSSQSPPSFSRSPAACALSYLRLPLLVGFVFLTSRFYAEEAPISYYLYAFFPAVFWTAVVRDLDPFLRLFRASPSASSASTRTSLGAVATLAALHLMAHGYTDRRAFAVIAAGMACGWPLTLGSAWREKNARLLAAWAGTMGTLAVFPLLPVEKGEELRIVAAGALFLVGLGFVASDAVAHAASPTWPRTRRFLLAEIVLTLACLGITRHSALSLQAKQGLPAVSQWLGWAVLITASLLPLIHGRPSAQPYLERLGVLLFAFSPAFIILSLSYEALFYGVFCAALVAWVFVESSLGSAKKESQGEGTIEARHVRVAVFFLAFLHLGFFGVGNVASISSFYLEPVYRLMTVFAPFPMGALLLFKLLIPFVALAGVSSVVNRRLRLPPLSLFLVGSVLSDVLTINFFFHVTDTGSWLEIGSSITNFVICSLLGLFSSVLLVGGEYLMAGTVG